MANARAAKAAAVTAYMTETYPSGVTATEGAFEADYDASAGVLVSSYTGAGYGKGTSTTTSNPDDTALGFKTSDANTGKHIHVKVDKDGKVQITWAAGA